MRPSLEFLLLISIKLLFEKKYIELNYLGFQDSTIFGGEKFIGISL